MGLLDGMFDSEGGRLGLGLLAAGSARGDGAGAGQRLMEAVGSVDQWKKQKAAEEMQRQQLAAHQQAMQMQAMQMQAAQAQIAQQQKIREGMGQFFKPGQQSLSPLAGDASTGILPSAGRAAVAPSFDTTGAAQFLAQNGEYEKALSMLPKKEQQINKLDVKDFTPASVAKFAQSQNYGDLVRMDKLHMGTEGGDFKGRNPFTGEEVVSSKNTKSFSDVAAERSNAVAWANNAATLRGQDLTNARAKEANGIQQQASRTQVMQTPEGLIAIDKGTNSATPVTMGGAPVRSEDAMKKGANAKTVISLLDAADKLLPGSTGSTIGAGVDLLAGFGGTATKGATAIAQLKTIEGQLIGNMPRMEGPQSDADRMLYQQAAGDLANPMKPVSIRQAASKTIRELQQRYTTPSSGGSTGGWSITKE